MSHMNKQGTGPFLQGALIGSKVRLYSLNFFADVQSLGMFLLDMTFQSKSWLINPQLETGNQIFIRFMQINIFS